MRTSILFACILILIPWLAGCASSWQRSRQTTLTVLTINLHHNDSTDARAGTRQIADAINELDPDVVAVQGLRRSVVQSDMFDVLTALSELTGMTYAFGETRADDVSRYGNGFLTRHPILEESNTLYPAGGPGKQSGLLRLVLDIKGTEVRVMNTHLGTDAGERHISELRDLIRLTASPRLLLARSDGPSGDALSVSLRGTLVDAWEQAEAGPGLPFPSSEPGRRLDFVFFNPGRPGFRVMAAKTLEAEKSMHVPLMVEFELLAN